jgi:hypothetical protein
MRRSYRLVCDCGQPIEPPPPGVCPNCGRPIVRLRRDPWRTVLSALVIPALLAALVAFAYWWVNR